MWIKDNKSSLLNIDKIVKIELLDFENLSGNRSYSIGIYFIESIKKEYKFSSEVRCKEIINAIQSHIEHVEYAKNYNLSGSSTRPYVNYDTIYEMPCN